MYINSKSYMGALHPEPTPHPSPYKKPPRFKVGIWGGRERLVADVNGFKKKKKKKKP
jgi:hypothetical protein